MSKKALGCEFLLLLVTIIWGFGFIAQYIGGGYLDVFSFNLFRNVIAAIFLFIIVLIMGAVKKRKGKAVPENRKELWIGGTLIGIALAVAMNLQQLGINLEGAGKSGFLTALYIVLVPVFSLFFGKKINKFLLIAIVFAMTGLYLINARGGNFTFSWGTVSLLGCALAYTVQIMLIDKYSKNHDSIKLSCIEFTVASVCCLPFALIFGNISLESIIKAMPSILYLGVLSSGVAYTFQIVAQKEVNVTVACIIMSMESVFSLIFGVIFLNEAHTWFEYLGCVSIFVAVILAQLPDRKKKKNQSEG